MQHATIKHRISKAMITQNYSVKFKMKVITSKSFSDFLNNCYFYPELHQQDRRRGNKGVGVGD